MQTAFVAATAALLCLAASVPSVAGGESRFTGQVVAVSDGDSITVLRGREPIRIRLDGIDCPEGGQDFGQRAKQFTSSLVFGREVGVVPTDVDRYGRTVARVTVDGRDLSLELARAGLAWHFTRYSSDPELAAAEREARAARRGLWQQPHPTPPWDYRRPTPQMLASASHGPFHGNVRSHVFHGPACQHYHCANCTRVFASRGAAEAAGFRPHAACVK